MTTIYDSYPPGKEDLADKEASGFQPRPQKKKDEDIPCVKYTENHPLENRPFEKLLANWR